MSKSDKQKAASALIDASAEGKLDTVRSILHENPKLLDEAKDEYNDSVLHVAAANGKVNVVEFLIKDRGAAVDTRGYLGRTPLIHAAQKGHIAVVKCLVEHGCADIYAKATTEDEAAAIHLAAYFGRLDVVEYLLQKKPDLLEGAKNKYNDTALHRAAANGQMKVVEFLVREKRAKLETRGFEGRTPLIIAAGEDRMQVVQYLVERGADINAKATSDNEPTAALLAAEFGHFNVLSYLVNKQPTLLEKSRDNQGDTIFHLAAAKGHLKIVQLLVDRHANVEIKGCNGKTPLITAAECGQLQVVKYLVDEAGANIYAKDDENEETAVHMAAQMGYIEVVAFLLNRKPDLLEFARDGFNDTVLHRAVSSGQLKVVEFLVKEKHANVELGGQFGRTPLIEAAGEGHLPVVKFLVEQCRAKLDAADESEDEDTAMHLAALFGHVNVVAYLVSCKASLKELVNKKGLTPLDYAKCQNSPEVARFLEANGATPHVYN